MVTTYGFECDLDTNKLDIIEALGSEMLTLIASPTWPGGAFQVPSRKAIH
jgi:hypothetical protein